MKQILFVLTITWTSTVFGINSDQLMFLSQLVNTNTSTENQDGLESLRALIKNEFERLNFEVKLVDANSSRPYSHQVMLIRRPHSNNSITLLGHIDTVFPPTSDFNSITVEENVIRGPGVIDMKSGILLLREIVQALNEDDLSHVQIILNDDEEIGSIFSKSIIRHLIPASASVLIFEPGLADGSVVTSQSGVAWFELSTQGKAAHAGLEPETGFNACTELANKITRVAELSDLNRGVNLNPGVVSGGSKPNVVCDQANVKIDMRFKTTEQYNLLSKDLQKITDTVYSRFLPPKFIPTSQLKQLAFLPPLNVEKTSTLFDLVLNLSNALGIKIKGAHVGYGSDGNNISDLPVNVLVGLGPYGGGMHTKNEFMDIGSFESRMKLNLGLIKKLIKQQRQ